MRIQNGILHLEDNDTSRDLKNILLDRNNQWVEKKKSTPQYNGSLRTIVLSCIDSRVQVENIFNAKPGELLVLKNAGNYSEFIIRSILIGALELNAKFIVILGHENCGMAIRGTPKIEKIKKELGEEFLNKIEERVKKNPMEWFGFFDQGGWIRNVYHQKEVLEKLLKDMLPPHKIPDVIPALYDVETGAVTFLSDKETNIN
jgi:carbonic anhydrase